MVAWMVAAWYCYVRAQERPAWGVAAGLCALLAFFTKAAGAFFVLTRAPKGLRSVAPPGTVRA